MPPRKTLPPSATVPLPTSVEAESSHQLTKKQLAALCPSEESEQMALCEYLEYLGWTYSATAHNTFAGHYEGGRKVAHYQSMARNKRLGVKPGVPDLFVCVPCIDGITRLIWIEMKRAKPARSEISNEQVNMLTALASCEGVNSKVCYGAKEAIDFIVATQKQTYLFSTGSPS